MHMKWEEPAETLIALHDPHNVDRVRQSIAFAKGCSMRTHRFALLLALGLLASQVPLATARQATPNADPDAPLKGVTIDRLIEATLGPFELPRTVDTLALTGLIFLPGAEVTAANGMHLIFVEAGALTVQEYLIPPPGGAGTPSPGVAPAGPPVTYAAGESFLVSDVGAAPATVTNAGAEPVAALVVSLLVSPSGADGAGIADALVGSAELFPLAVEAAARVGPPLSPRDGLDAEPIFVALERRTYEPAEANPSLPPPFERGDPAARLLASEAGTVEVRPRTDALYRPADGDPVALRPGTPVALGPGEQEQLLVLAPGGIAIRNVVDVPSVVLILSVGAAPSTTARG
jgi:hypothetical protein